MSATIRKTAAVLAISAAVVAVTAQGCKTETLPIKYSFGASDSSSSYYGSKHTSSKTVDYGSAAYGSSYSVPRAPSSSPKIKISTAEKKASKNATAAATSARKTVYYSLTPAERDRVERVVMASCGELDDYLMAEANAQVILDRVKSGRFGDDIMSVLTSPHQFERPWRGNVNAMVKKAVSAVFDNGERVCDEHIFYYINPHICSISLGVWEKDKRYITTVGTGKYIHQYWTDKS